MAPTVHLPTEIMILDHQFMILKKFRYDLLLCCWQHLPRSININYSNKGELFYVALFKKFVHISPTFEQHTDLLRG